MENINSDLLDHNRLIENTLLDEAEKYYRNKDLRWFFTFAHAKITQQINKNLLLFEQPNALLKLNIHFAEEFIRALWGNPHRMWKQAFNVCKALQKGASETILLIFETEICGSIMANIHIKIDLAAALKEIGCISYNDYANMLVFVNRGALAALAKLRGNAWGSVEAILQQFIAPFLDLEIKSWRNTVYETECNMSVPSVNSDFTQSINHKKNLLDIIENSSKNTTSSNKKLLLER